MIENNYVLFYSGLDQHDVEAKEHLKGEFEREGISITEFDISQKYTLYGNIFTYENAFILDYCENGKLRNFSTPALRAGNKLIVGFEAIRDTISILKK